MSPAGSTAELKVPKATLDQWAYRRVGPPFMKIGRHRRYRRVDVERWLDAHTTGGDAACVRVTTNDAPP